MSMVSEESYKLIGQESASVRADRHALPGVNIVNHRERCEQASHGTHLES
jgi:hypothetical protein